MSYLLAEFNNRKIQLENRSNAAYGYGNADEQGRMSRDILDYYNEKSKGGYISLIIIEHSYISEYGKASKNQLSVAENSCIEGFLMGGKAIESLR